MGLAKRKVVYQPSFFRGELWNFTVVWCSESSMNACWQLGMGSMQLKWKGTISHLIFRACLCEILQQVVHAIICKCFTPPKTNEHTLPKTDRAPSRRPRPKRKLIFQPCFRCYVSPPETTVITSQVVSGIWRIDGITLHFCSMLATSPRTPFTSTIESPGQVRFREV